MGTIQTSVVINRMGRSGAGASTGIKGKGFNFQVGGIRPDGCIIGNFPDMLIGAKGCEGFINGEGTSCQMGNCGYVPESCPFIEGINGNSAIQALIPKGSS